MASIAFDIANLYRRTFGREPYQVQKPTDPVPVNTYYLQDIQKQRLVNNAGGAPLTAKDIEGVDIWLPTEFYNLPAGIGTNGRLQLYYSTISITGSASYVRTPLVERKGTAKELYSIDDYKITLRGFFIDKEYRSFPEKDIKALKALHESGTAFSIYNAVSDIILAGTDLPGYEQQKVVISDFQLPAVEGGRKSMRPFTIQLESDNIFTLEVA